MSDAVRDYGFDAIVWNELDGVFILHYLAVEPLFLPSFASISEVSVNLINLIYVKGKTVKHVEHIEN